MKYPIEDQINELLKSGRITEAAAEILIRHYAKQPDQFKEEMAAAPEEANRAHLMRLIDLLEKKNEMRKAPAPPEDPALQKENPPDVSAQSSPEDQERSPMSPDISRLESEKEVLEIHNENLRRRCEALEAALEAEKESHGEFEKKTADYTKKYADAEEAERRVRSAEESKKKALEEEHRQLLEEVRRTHKNEKLDLEKALEGRSAELVALGQEKERLAKELARSQEEKSKASAGIKRLEESTVQAEWLKKRNADLESELARIKSERDEKVRALGDLAKTVKELEARLSEKGTAQATLE